MNILDFIPHGIQHAISQDELSARVGRDRRTVRKLIHAARCDGKPICSTCDGADGGYYIPLDTGEAMHYYRMQTARIHSANLALEPVREYIEGEGGLDG